MADDILVIGRIKRDGSSASVTYTSSPYNSSATADWGDRHTSTADTSSYTTATVQVGIANAGNRTAATTAAQNIARALARIEAELEALPSNTPIKWGDNVMTAGQVLNVLNTTKWVVTDQSQFNNGGVGAADGVTNTVTLYYGSFDGTNGDYASSTYQNDAGLVGILLHEIGHMTPAGEEVHNMSVYYCGL